MLFCCFAFAGCSCFILAGSRIVLIWQVWSIWADSVHLGGFGPFGQVRSILAVQSYKFTVLRNSIGTDNLHRTTLRF
jgi:hypothetical protein